MKFNLLEDPLIRVRSVRGSLDRLSLPEVYLALSTDQVAAFPALRPHQSHAWHAFLAQIASVALGQRGGSLLPESARQWRELIRSLTPRHGADEPWCLEVDDPSVPAFMQCPAPTGLSDYRRKAVTPDDLDLLVTAKNHDVKRSIAVHNKLEDWVFALVDLQTMSGFLGSGNYGIARMNGGYSSRPCLGLSPTDGRMGTQLFFDIDRMLGDREALLARMAPYYCARGGMALLWLEPWDGTESLDPVSLDPYFVEVCRRVRLVWEGGNVVAYTAPSRKSRVDARAAKGALGDFWTPLDIRDPNSPKAWSISSTGFTYRRLSQLLFDHAAYRLPEAIGVGASTDESRWRLVARGVAGGQGKTEGYHERTDISLAEPVAKGLSRKDTRHRLAEISRNQIREIAGVASALRFSIATVASGGKFPSEIEKANRARADQFATRLDREADARFFAALERRFLAADEEQARVARADFGRHLVGVARAVLCEAVETVPCPTFLRHRARAWGLAAFESNLRKSVFDDQPEVYQGLGKAITVSADRDDGAVSGSLDMNKLVPQLATEVAGLDSASVAALRRGPLAGAGSAAFWDLVAAYGIGSRPEEWASVLQAMAILTPVWGSAGRATQASAHDRSRPMGAAMFGAGVSELRLARLLSTRGHLRCDMLIRLCRRLSRAAENRRFDLVTLGWFAVHQNEETDRQIARDYCRAAPRQRRDALARASTTQED